jgi:hypothetical protein
VRRRPLVSSLPLDLSYGSESAQRAASILLAKMCLLFPRVLDPDFPKLVPSIVVLLLPCAPYHSLLLPPAFLPPIKLIAHHLGLTVLFPSVIFSAFESLARITHHFQLVSSTLSSTRTLLSAMEVLCFTAMSLWIFPSVSLCVLRIRGLHCSFCLSTLLVLSSHHSKSNVEN